MSYRSFFRGRAAPLIIVGVALLAAGCGRSEPPPAEEAAAVAAEPPEREESAGPAPRPIAEERELVVERGGEGEPTKIYYELTAFDWYRRGEPLIFGGRSYALQGRPQAIQTDDLRRAGRYRGVLFYLHEDDDPPYTTVFVPVYPGFWQPFVATPDTAAS